MIFIGAPKRQHLFSFLIYQMIAHSPICVMYNFLKLLSLHFRCILKIHFASYSYSQRWVWFSRGNPDAQIGQIYIILTDARSTGQNSLPLTPLEYHVQWNTAPWTSFLNLKAIDIRKTVSPTGKKARVVCK